VASRFRPDEANNPLDGVLFSNSWLLSSSILYDIEERVTLAEHAMIVVDGFSNANDSESKTSLCTVIAASHLDLILLTSLLMSRHVKICKTDVTLAAAWTRFFTKPWRQLLPFTSVRALAFSMYKLINAFHACALSSSNSWYSPCLLESSA
jgi:hypothetical protein